MSSLERLVLELNFESWVKLLGPSCPIQKLRNLKFRSENLCLPMNSLPPHPNPGLAYARLAWLTSLWPTELVFLYLGPTLLACLT